MNKIFPLIAFMCVTNWAMSQLTVSLYHDNVPAANEIMELHTLPFDESRLIQVEYFYPGAMLPNGEHSYKIMKDVTNGVEQPYLIPLCSELTQILFLENGILASGLSFSDGQELIYWDGTNVTTFDLNPQGHSFPRLERIEDKVYAIGEFNGTYKAVEFDESTVSITEAVNSSELPRRLVANHEGDFFYQTYDDTGAFPTYALHSNDGSSGSIQIGGTVASIVDSQSSGHTGYWGNPLHNNGKLYLTQQFLNPTQSGGGEVKILELEESTPGNYTATTLFQETAATGFAVHMFEWNGSLCYYHEFSTELYISTDWVNFQLAGTASGEIREYLITENGRLFFTVGVNNSWDSFQLQEFTSSFNFEMRIPGRHMHIYEEGDHKIYLSDLDFNTYDQSIFIYDTQYDYMDSIALGAYNHNPIPNGSTMHEGTFKFILDFAFGDVMEIGLGALALDDNEIIGIEIAPNPFVNTIEITFDESLSGTVIITDMNGKQFVANVFEHQTSVALQTGHFPSGMYMLSVTDNEGNQFIERMVKL